MARGTSGGCYLGEFVLVATTIPSPCGQGALIFWGRAGIVRISVGVVVMTMYSVYQQTIKTVIGGKSE